MSSYTLNNQSVYLIITSPAMVPAEEVIMDPLAVLGIVLIPVVLIVFGALATAGDCQRKSRREERRKTICARRIIMRVSRYQAHSWINAPTQPPERPEFFKSFDQ